MTSSLIFNLTMIMREELQFNRRRYLKEFLRGRKHSRIMMMTMNSRTNTKIKLRRKVHQSNWHQNSNNTRRHSRTTMMMKRKIVMMMLTMTR